VIFGILIFKFKNNYVSQKDVTLINNYMELNMKKKSWLSAVLFTAIMVISASAMAEDLVRTDGEVFTFNEVDKDGWKVYKNGTYVLRTSGTCELPDDVITSIARFGNPLPTAFGPTDNVSWSPEGGGREVYCGIHNLTRNVDDLDTYAEYSFDTKKLTIHNAIITRGDEVESFPLVVLENVNGRFALVYIDTGAE